MVAGVAAVISCQHACELVTIHGETGVTAHLLPFTLDGLIWAAPMFSRGRSLLRDVALECPGGSSCNTSPDAWCLLSSLLRGLAPCGPATNATP
jgi:hypothetical protein